MGHQGYESRARTRKRNRDKHKKLGLCVYCSNEAVPNRAACKYHLERDREKSKKCREKIKSLK